MSNIHVAYSYRSKINDMRGRTVDDREAGPCIFSYHVTVLRDYKSLIFVSVMIETKKKITNYKNIEESGEGKLPV